MTTVIPAIPATPVRTVNFAKIVPLFKTAASVELVLSRTSSQDVQLLRRGNVHGKDLQLQWSMAGKPTELKELQTTTFSVEQTSGVISRAARSAELKNVGTAEMDLPYGMPRFVNVATLKSMLKAKLSDVMLKKIGDWWEICGDAMVVDLLDDSVEFRLGQVQIFS
jgi:hypothetical protein